MASADVGLVACEKVQEPMVELVAAAPASAVEPMEYHVSLSSPVCTAHPLTPSLSHSAEFHYKLAMKLYEDENKTMLPTPAVEPENVGNPAFHTFLSHSSEVKFNRVEDAPDRYVSVLNSLLSPFPLFIVLTYSSHSAETQVKRKRKRVHRNRKRCRPKNRKTLNKPPLKPAGDTIFSQTNYRDQTLHASVYDALNTLHIQMCQVQLPPLQEVTAYIQSVYDDGATLYTPEGSFTVDGIHRLLQLYGLLQLKRVVQYSGAPSLCVCVRNLC